jgi:hypothetical protein
MFIFSSSLPLEREPLLGLTGHSCCPVVQEGRRKKEILKSRNVSNVTGNRITMAFGCSSSLPFSPLFFLSGFQIIVPVRW